MNPTVPLQTGETLGQDALLLASLVLTDVNQLISGIQAIVAVLLRYVTMGVSITNCLMGLVGSTPAQEY